LQPSEAQEKKFSVIGGARSGLAVAKLLRARGASVFLSEKALAEKMPQAIDELEKLGMPYEFGDNTQRILDADVIVLSPGVPSDIPVLKAAKARAAKIVNEIEVASWFCLAPIIAITGTNGKTTTTALVGRIFEDARRHAIPAGNIGTAFSQIVDQLTQQSVAIVEVSSFQLDHIESFRPTVTVLLNITPDHLDRYQQSFEQYVASKCRVFENQRAGDSVIYNLDDEVAKSNVEKLVDPRVKKLPFSTKESVKEGAFVEGDRLRTIVHSVESDVIAAGDLSVRGKHNLHNAMAASLVAKVMDISTASLRSTLKNFRGVEHRLEFVRQVNGVTFINDSKATNVESVWYALQSFDQPIIAILGGRDKGNDYSRLLDVVREHVKNIVAVGESAEKIVGVFTPIVTVTKVTTMKEAVHTAASLASSGDVVLLSPACASFDWFENYEHRGHMFKQIVMDFEAVSH
jgi:UDP-N-acetylmuramoylalanine--D-glutamate ligase